MTTSLRVFIILPTHYSFRKILHKVTSGILNCYSMI